VRLDESLYSIKNIGENGRPLGDFSRLVGAPVDEKSCLPPMVFQDKACSDATQKHQLQAYREEPEQDVFVFTDHTIYIDPGISGEMKKKVRSMSIAASFCNGWHFTTLNHRFQEENLVFFAAPVEGVSY
jgi:hypothetical protein